MLHLLKSVSIIVFRNKGEVLPWALHEEELRSTHPFAVFELRGMLAVPYFEKRLYELPDAEVTPERIIALADEIEREIQGGLAARPLLSVPHILSDEASCYCLKVVINLTLLLH